MIRPKKVNILGKTHKVVYSDDGYGCNATDEVFGRYSRENLEVIICNGLVFEEFLESFLHEVLHGIDDITGLKLGEKKVNLLAVYLSDFLLRNKIIKP